MAQVYYCAPIINNDGIALQELDATVDVTISIINGEPHVEVDSFEAEALNGIVLVYSSYCDDPFMRQIFLRAKEALESDDKFINAALEQDDELYNTGKGANDPDGRLVRRAA